MLFDSRDKELYFFGDDFNKQGARTLSDIESSQLNKMTEGLFDVNAQAPEFIDSACIDYCLGNSLTNYENQTYWTWSAPFNATLYPQPSGSSHPQQQEIFERIKLIANSMKELCRCIK